MSIIKALQDYLAAYDGMELQPIPKVLTDRPDEQPSSFALAPSGNGKTSADLDGNKTYRNNYVFYAKAAAADETDRRDNYDFLEGFADWLEEQDAAGSYPELPGGCEAESLEVSNALLFDLFEDGTGLYQVQIQLVYTKMKG